ncbi:hypothetical protein [Nostoc punctiforme]|uniref:hypothetical protein n=1 Tax=Nostoc punctiforme TaxID=272131 RepID=UPI001427D644|nr:hypothetical protein [Nostoc punctiforme]
MLTTVIAPHTPDALLGETPKPYWLPLILFRLTMALHRLTIALHRLTMALHRLTMALH